MSEEEQSTEIKPAKKRFGRMEAMILIPNLILLGIVLLYLGATNNTKDEMAPAVEADPRTKALIASLEDSLLRDPANLEKALKLARLYREVGEFPWSYNALLNAERQRKYREPKWQLRLGLAYLEIGKNSDALRVLEAAHKVCGATGTLAKTEDSARSKCAPPVKVKLELFKRLAKIFVKRKIHPARNPRAANSALRQVLKPVTVDHEKMRSKGPLQPEKTAPEKAAPHKAPAPEKARPKS